MKKIYTSLAVIFASLSLVACGQTATQACSDHGGVKPNSVEVENDGGAEARCNDNTEIENADGTSPQAKGWTADE